MSVSEKMKSDCLKWFFTGETGMSSRAMAGAVLGYKAGGTHPVDPSDFNRCLKFLIAVPDAKKNLHKVAKLSGIWKLVVDRWDEIEQCFLDEVGIDWEKGKQLKATKTYALMKEIGC